MNVWLLAATLLALAMLPGIALTLRGDAELRLVGLQSVNVLAPLALVAAAVGFGRAVYIDVALVLALLSFVGGIAYARFLERWL